MTIELTQEEAKAALELWNIGLKASGGPQAAEAYLVLHRKVAAAAKLEAEADAEAGQPPPEPPLD